MAHLPRSELKKHLCLKWRSEPDALTITQISKITGYNMQTVGQWNSKGKLQYVSCPDGRKVAKRWLIQFMTDYILASPYRLSYTNEAHHGGSGWVVSTAAGHKKPAAFYDCSYLWKETRNGQQIF